VNFCIVRDLCVIYLFFEQLFDALYSLSSANYINKTYIDICHDMHANNKPNFEECVSNAPAPGDFVKYFKTVVPMCAGVVVMLFLDDEN
jgi:hypothetical protein